MQDASDEKQTLNYLFISSTFKWLYRDLTYIYIVKIYIKYNFKIIYNR